MTQCCYKTDCEDHQSFPKIDAVPTSKFTWEYERNIQPISQCYAGCDFRNIACCRDPSKKYISELHCNLSFSTFSTICCLCSVEYAVF